MIHLTLKFGVGGTVGDYVVRHNSFNTSSHRCCSRRGLARDAVFLQLVECLIAFGTF